MKESKEKGFRFKIRELHSKALDTIINLMPDIVKCRANQKSLQEKLERKKNKKQWMKFYVLSKFQKLYKWLYI